jgi:hypothetical protein
LDIDTIAGQLTSHGFAVVQNALPAVLLASLDEGCRDPEAAHFAPAGTGRGKDRKRDGLIRSDVIRWLDEGQAADRLYLTLMEDLRVGLNERLCLGLFSYEGHYAIYATGSRYERHVDSMAGPEYPVHHRGSTSVPGLHFIGLPWLYTWGSGRFSGVADDARHLAEQIDRRRLPLRRPGAIAAAAPV